MPAHTRINFKKAFIILSAITVAASLAACNLFRHTPPKILNAQRDDFRVYVIRRQGETLGGIANRTSGNSNNWKRILAANPGLDPLSIKVGDRVRIPREIIKKDIKSTVFLSSSPSKASSPRPKVKSTTSSAPGPTLKAAEVEIPLAKSQPSTKTEKISVIRDPVIDKTPIKEAPAPETIDPVPLVPEKVVEEPQIIPSAIPPAPTTSAKIKNPEEEALVRRYEALMEIIESEDDPGNN